MNKPVTLTTEQQLLLVRMPCRLRGTYITWLLGFDPYFHMRRETYYRHAVELATKYRTKIRKKLIIKKIVRLTNMHYAQLSI